ncbi:MAG: cellulose biosynthesis protein BcsG, partial [Rhizobacter sp.]|nr:cellulose biosynthesis protein BcsG [Rhizobacter sp.]
MDRALSQTKTNNSTAGEVDETPSQAQPDRAEQSVAAPTANIALPRLGWWNAYFLAKLALFWQGVIGLHAIENLAFAAALLVPLHRKAWVVARALFALPLGLALLYHDSFLPPLSRLFAQASQVSSFSLGYLVEIAQRFVSWPAMAAIVAAIALYSIAARRLRVGVLVVATLLAMSVLQRPVGPTPAGASAQAADRVADVAAGGAAREPSDLDAVLLERYAREATRQVVFAAPAAEAPPFDLIFLHVCSMSWDDLRATGLERHPLLERLDIVLTQFNSAASYSGPAVIRMLRAPCGQSPHAGLYAQPEQANCYLMPALQQAGFEPRLVLNHDGHFDDFLGVVKAQGNQALAAQPLDGLPVAQRSFDDSPIFDDLAVLRRHNESLRSTAPQRVATYFNSISLHDGNRLVGANSALNSLASYKIRLSKLLDDLDTFMTDLERGGRRAVVVLLPEHGAAFRGDRMQIAGMREVPTPAITHVPVGIKVLGADARRSGDAVRVDRPTSYLAVSAVIARMLERS